MIKLRDLEVRTDNLNVHEIACLSAFNHTATYSCIKDGKTPIVNTNYTTCHSQIRGHNPKSLSAFSGVYDFYKPGAKELFEFLISETGPFKDLRIFDGVYLFGHHPDEPRGFTLPDHVWQNDFSYPLLYAFLINSRIPHEHPAHAEAFGYLIAAGHSPNLMFIMSKYLAIKGGVLTRSGQAWVFGHNSLIEQPAQTYGGDPCLIDVRMFCNNEYHKGIGQNSYTRELWKMKPHPKGKPMLSQFVWTGYSEKVNTRFTSIERIASEKEIQMIEDFKKFVDLRYEEAK